MRMTTSREEKLYKSDGQTNEYKVVMHFLSNILKIDRKRKFRIKGRIRSSVFLHIFTVAFLLFLATAGGSNPTGPIS